jgi:hypothetical protein
MFRCSIFYSKLVNCILLRSLFVFVKGRGTCGSGERNVKILIDFRKSPIFSLTSPLSSSFYVNIEEKVWLFIGEKNTDMKRLTGRLKLCFLTEIGWLHWNQGEEVTHFTWFGESWWHQYKVIIVVVRSVCKGNLGAEGKTIKLQKVPGNLPMQTLLLSSHLY